MLGKNKFPAANGTESNCFLSANTTYTLSATSASEGYFKGYYEDGTNTGIIWVNQTRDGDRRSKVFTPEKNIIKEEIIEPVKINNFKENLELKVDYNFEKQAEKEKFIKRIEENPNLLYNLSLDRIEALESYYDELIEQDRKELERLKKAV